MLVFPNWYCSDTSVVISCSPLPSVAATYVCIQACTTCLWTAGSVSLRLRCPVFITRPHSVWKRKPVDFTQPLLSDLHWPSHSHSHPHHETWKVVFSLFFCFSACISYSILHIHKQYEAFTTERLNTPTTAMCRFIIKTNIKMNKEIQTKKHIEGKDKRKKKL